MGCYGETLSEKVERWKRELNYEKIVQMEAFKLIDNKILPILLNNDYCHQNELYKGQPENIKNVVRGLLNKLSKGKNAPIIRERKGSTYMIMVKNKTKLENRLNKEKRILKNILDEREKNIKNYEKKYVKESGNNEKILTNVQLPNETEDEPSVDKVSINTVNIDAVFPNLNDLQQKKINLSNEQYDNLKLIIKKYWNDQCTENLINVFNDYGAYRFWSWVFCEEINYFLDRIIGSKKHNLLIEELKNFFQLNSINPLHIGLFLMDFYKGVLKQQNLYGYSYGNYWEPNEDKFKKIRKCLCCGNDFNPYLVKWYLTSKPSKLIKICGNCYEEADILRKDKISKKTKEEMLTDLRNLVDALGFIPDQNLGKIRDIIDAIPEETEIEAITIMKNMHSFGQYKCIFGSYFKALVEAGILDEGTRSEGRGTRCIALDGHECHSLAEQYIDNWLFHNNIPHVREPIYPKTGFRADWKVGKYFIEYWGLKGQEDYDEKIDTKRKIAKNNNISLIEISHSDLPKINTILKKLKDEYGTE